MSSDPASTLSSSATRTGVSVDGKDGLDDEGSKLGMRHGYDVSVRRSNMSDASGCHVIMASRAASRRRGDRGMYRS